LVGFLELATALFVSFTPVLSHLLPASELRARLTTCSSSLLAAVVQHSSLRNRIPQRSSVTDADFAMLIVYILVTFAFTAAILSSFLLYSRILKKRIDVANRIIRNLGLCSPLLFLVIFWSRLGGPRSVVAWFFGVLLVGAGSVLITFCGSYIFPVLVTIIESLASCRFVVLESANRNYYKGVLHYDRVPANPSEEDIDNDAKEQHMNMLDSNQTSQWVEGLYSSGVHISRKKLQNYADIFLKEEIDGETLSYLDANKLHSLGIPLGHAIKLNVAIKDALELERSKIAEELNPSKLSLS